jgi:hypothetical protein
MALLLPGTPAAAQRAIERRAIEPTLSLNLSLYLATSPSAGPCALALGSSSMKGESRQ